jgi:hypothetical protein
MKLHKWLLIGALFAFAKVSPEGVFFKVPYFSVDIPFPSLTLTNKVGTTVLKVGSVETSKSKSK